MTDTDTDERKLSEQDLERVRKVTTSGIHAVERKPFRPFRLMFIIVAAMISLSLFSLWMASIYV